MMCSVFDMDKNISYVDAELKRLAVALSCIIMTLLIVFRFYVDICVCNEYYATYVYRDGVEELCGILQRAGVPVLVLSAGMGDVLVEVLQHFNVYTDNIKVVANFFKYNKEVRTLFLLYEWSFLS